MILIADSGSTKTSWCYLQPGKEHIYFNTEGFNPYYVDSKYIADAITNHLPVDINVAQVAAIYFYGAGCSTDKIPVVEQALQSVFKHAENISVQSDLLAAARSVLGNQAGFVAILGTGTNSCLFDGEKMVYQVDSLGFVLGDEGSGAYLGKQLLIAYCRALLPKDLQELFWDTFKITPDEVINQIYTKPLPNRFSASFSRFVGEHIAHPYIIDLVKNAFRALFTNIICHYPDYKKYSFNCVGSVAHNYLPFLIEVAAEFNMSVGNVIRNPIDGLIKYHETLINKDQVV